MKTENILETVSVERVGTLHVLRTIDFQKMADESADGKIDANALLNGGDFSVRLTPTGRDATATEFPVASYEGGQAFVAGFQACANARKREGSAGGKASDFNPEEFMKSATKAGVEDLKKPQTMKLAKFCGVAFKNAEKKGDIADRIIKAKKLK